MNPFRNRRTPRSSQIGDGVARSAEGERLYQYFVAGPTPQAISARCTAAVPDTSVAIFIPADKGFELMLEGVAVGAEGTAQSSAKAALMNSSSRPHILGLHSSMRPSVKHVFGL